MIKAKEAIQRLVSVKARITAKLARQVAEAADKTMGAKKPKVRSGLDQEERKAANNLDQVYWEKIFWEPKKPTPKKNSPYKTEKTRTKRLGPCLDNQAHQINDQGADPEANTRQS